MAEELRVYRADLHVHTCLSPCADLDMSPGEIVRTALRKKLDIIAVTDHNSAENYQGVRGASRGKPLAVMGGMEVTTREEVHLLAYFPTGRKLKEFQDLLYGTIEDAPDPRVSADQVVANAKDEVEGFCAKNLWSASRLSIDELARTIHRFSGVCAPAHIDREGFGIIGQLGFIPGNLEMDAVECYDLDFPVAAGLECPRITSSDAHRACDIGRRVTGLLLKAPTFSEFRKALRSEGGRKVVRL